MSDISDQDFMAFAEDYEKEELQNRRGGAGGGSTFTEIHWTGLEPNKMKIIRALGGIPGNPRADKYTARFATIGRIKGDNGKEFRSVLPPKEVNPDHLMWRIINRVNEVAYINRKRIFVNETKHQDIFDLVNFNGFAPGDPKRKYTKGWEGRNVLIMNVIDRERMDWHKEHKHTFLLSRNVSQGTDGRVFADEGVPVYGFFNVITTTLFKHYGNWENYDMGIVRTGQQQTPYRIINASAYVTGKLPEISKEQAQFVSVSPLTEEELSWARHDLEKSFSPTTFTKYYNNLRIAIQTIDARLNTKFYQELEFEMNKEKTAREIHEAEKLASTQPAVSVTVPASPALTPAPAAPATRATIRTVAATVGTLSPEMVGALKGWAVLEKEEREAILSVDVKDGIVRDITYNSTDSLVGCPSCKIPGPESFSACPGCGMSFRS